ncbi:MAG: tungstate transport system ATP-binding protein [Cellvibrionaceae bacterium]|jgi:tungstate transport system ATP-binding protein
MTKNETHCYTLKQVTKRYDRREVLSVDELLLKTGEIFALVGPSGAGKSTLLRLLAFLEQPTSGKITWQGRPVTPRWPTLDSRRTVTMVFQQPRLLKRTVIENIGYGLNLRGEDVTNHSRFHALVDELGIADLLQEKAKNLSGGEQQRVSLARALILSPAVLILDEPTASLDPQNVALVERMIKQENEAYGTTIIMVTHNIFQAKRISHRTGLVLNGRLQEVCDTQTFFENPHSAEAKMFVSGEIVY